MQSIHLLGSDESQREQLYRVVVQTLHEEDDSS